MSWDGPGQQEWVDPAAIGPLEDWVSVPAELVRLVESLPSRVDGFTQEARATFRGRDTSVRFDLRAVGAQTVEVRAKRHMGTVTQPVSGDPEAGQAWQLHGADGVTVRQLWKSSEVAAAVAWSTFRWEQEGRPGPLRFEWGRRPGGV